MLDYFADSPAPAKPKANQQASTKAAQPSMLDAFTDPPSKTNGTAQPSMLDSFMDPPSKPNRTKGTSSENTSTTNGAAAPSMLDAFMDPQRSRPQRHGTPHPPPPASMLDAFTQEQPAEKPKPKAKAPKSMLDDFM